MRFLLLLICAVVVSSCSFSGAIFGGSDGIVSSESRGVLPQAGASFKVVPSAGHNRNVAVEEELAEEFASMGFRPVQEADNADFAVSYGLVVDGPNTRLRNMSNGFSHTNEMYTFTTYSETLNLRINDSTDLLLWRGTLWNETATGASDVSARAYVVRLASEFAAAFPAAPGNTAKIESALAMAPAE